MSVTDQGRRRLRPEQRRELIVRAAADEFGRRGHADARLEDIARAAGTTKAVIYDHFADKAELHVEVVRRANRDALATAAAAVAGAADATPEERFRAALLASFELIAERPDVRTLLLGAPGVPDAVLKASAKEQRTARAAMAEVYLAQPEFLRGARNRRTRAEEIAQAVIGTINGIAVLGAEGATPRHLTDLAMRLLWPGLDAMNVRRTGP